MVSKRRVRVVVLCEDKQQRVFAERLLKGLSYQNKIRSLPVPAGQGAGEQYVREHYAEQVKELRRCSGHLQRALLVVIDADRGEVEDRQRQLADQLKTAGMPPRSTDERIAHLIPRHSIETWIECLLGKQVDETTTYPKLAGRESACQPAVELFIKLLRGKSSLTEQPLPSLLVAIDELKRLQ